MTIDATFLEKLGQLISSNTEVSALAAYAPDAGQRMLLDIPAGRKVEDFTDKLLEMQLNPQEHRGTIELTSLASFSAYVVRMTIADSVLFADQKAARLVCVFDHHEARQAPFKLKADLTDAPDAPPTTPVTVMSTNPAAKPRWGRHRAAYAFPFSEPWSAWHKMDREAMSQGALAEFIEEHITDILDVQNVNEIQSDNAKTLISQLSLRVAGRSQLLQAARGMKLKVSEQVETAVTTSSGEIQIGYSQSHQNADPTIMIPTAFVIALPVFEGGDWFELLVRLRYRKDGSVLKWTYDVYNMKRAIDAAFTSSCEKVQSETGLPLFFADTMTLAPA